MTTKTAERVLARLKYSMSNSYPEDSGVEGVKIWFSVNQYDGKKLPHGPRIKVNDLKTDKLIAIVTVEDNPVVKVGELKGKLKKLILAYIKLNRQVLDDHWEGKTSSKQAVNAIKPVPSKSRKG
jgi:hypothetical protein